MVSATSVLQQRQLQDAAYQSYQTAMYVAIACGAAAAVLFVVAAVIYYVGRQDVLMGARGSIYYMVMSLLIVASAVSGLIAYSNYNEYQELLPPS
jgi:FtsH-binding integral membrane protein